MEKKSSDCQPQNKLNLNDDSHNKARQIGNYILGSTIGQGTFGKVKLGFHVLTEEKVAIKILEKNKIADASDVERVTREIQILRQIRHETPKQLYLIMEYATDGELFDYIVKNKRIKDIEARVEYLHKINIVHRDLKPENLLLDHHKTIKLVDFGLSNFYKGNDTLKTACGSPCYAAPEMIAGKRYKGLSVDIWSCGVILFAMLCGYLPFEDQVTTALYKKIMNGEFKIPKFVSNDGRDLIQKLLTTDPNERYSLDDIKRHPWFNLCRSQSSISQGLFYSLRPSNQGIIIGKHSIPIDYNIVKLTEQKDFEKSNVLFSITNNKHNSAATTYYLFLKKLLREGGDSPADLTSENFKSSLICKESSSLMSQNNQSSSNGNGNLTTSTQPASSAAYERSSRENRKIHLKANSLDDRNQKNETHKNWKNSLVEKFMHQKYIEPSINTTKQEMPSIEKNITPSKRRFSQDCEQPAVINTKNNQIRNNYFRTVYNTSKSPPSYNFNIKFNEQIDKSQEGKELNQIIGLADNNLKDKIQLYFSKKFQRNPKQSPDHLRLKNGQERGRSVEPCLNVLGQKVNDTNSVNNTVIIKPSTNLTSRKNDYKGKGRLINGLNI